MWSLMSNNWIIVGASGEAAALAEVFSCPATQLSALVIGSRALAEEAACGVGKVAWIDAGDAPADDYADAAADFLLAAGVQVVAGVAAPAARAVLGLAGEKLGVGVVSNVIAATPGDRTVVEHLTTDDRVIETLEIDGPVAMLVNPLSVKEDARMAGEGSAAIEQVSAQPAGRIRRRGLEPAEKTGLESAEYVVGIGRGVKDHDAFDKASQLAAALEAEMGCTMPIYTDYDYLPEESHYIGLSGLHVAPKLYVALGVSGTSQHLAGIRNAGTVVCVNKDPNSKIFSNADYGIVGTVEDVVPALVAALG